MKITSLNTMTNIWSGSKELNGLCAALTNPTELSYKKGNIKKHYPIVFRGKSYQDAETAFQALKTTDPTTRENNTELMTEILIAKFQQYPQLFETVDKLGGENFLQNCDHIVTGRNWWEGKGVNSPFIRCLISAFLIVKRG